MRAVQITAFGGPLRVVDLPDPVAPPGAAVVRVEATGLCRSDWHGWMGHDPDITLPHVPGHELAGVVLSVGDGCPDSLVGQRVTTPFVCGCGVCRWCAQGDAQVCPHQTQPGFTHDGSFAEQVVVHAAALNLVPLPERLSFATAAALGCRFATAFRAVAQQGRPSPGSWVAVHGCGGVGLSAVLVARGLGSRVVAVDISDDALALATSLGAEATVNAAALRSPAAVGDRVREVTGGGAAVSLDALGSVTTSAASVHSLRRRGRHVQVGLLPPELGRPDLPMERVIGWELEMLGSHGMAAHAYPEMLAAVTSGAMPADRLVAQRISLDEAPAALTEMSTSSPVGITVIEPQR